MRQPRLGSEGWCRTLRAQMQEAVAAVEETNRVLGLARLIEQVRGLGQTTLAVMESFRQTTAGQDAEACPYMAWGLA